MTIFQKSGRAVNEVSEDFCRAEEVNILQSDLRKAKSLVGYQAITHVEKLVTIMTKFNYEELNQ